MTITRNQILAKLPDEVRSVPTRKWGTVYVRELKAEEFEAFWAIFELPPGIRRVAGFVALGLCDEDGSRRLEDCDVDALVDGSLEPLPKVADAFLSFNGIDLDEKKSLSLDATFDSGSPNSSESAIPIKSGRTQSSVF